MVRFGIYTDDFRFYYKTIRELKDWGLPFCSIDDISDIPVDIPVILSSSSDKPMDRFQIRESSPIRAIRKALPILAGKKQFSSLIIGMDPGPRPGVAILADLIITEANEMPDIHEAVLFIKNVLNDYNYKFFEIKIGNGDKPNRKKLVSEISDLNVDYTIVNERGTSGPHAIHNNALSAARMTLIDNTKFRKYPDKPGVKRKNAIESEFRTIKILV